MILLLLACEPQSFAECRGDLAEKTACRASFATPLPSSEAELEALADSIDDPDERDALLVELAVENPEAGARLCALTRTALGERQCTQVVGRPHLGHHRRE
ncbi:MAG TPA: hypothetical protein QGF58_22880 [Myxococcota bacterium]|nr:hypothetical protein [Myxococcota bacterium]